MARWEPDARGRLVAAAIELYAERGFGQTTAADIAERAGLTRRTFFRHFADKREVLFAGEGTLRQLLVDGIAAAPPGVAPIDVFARALGSAVATFFSDRPRDQAAKRHTVITANAELHERELAKLAELAAEAAEALRHRGVADPAASLTAEAGVTVFKISLARWVDGPRNRTLQHHLDESFAELRAVATA